MKILVTGGAGFIGSNFIHYWFEKYPDDHIVNLDILTYAGNLENLKNLQSQNYDFIKGDICNQELVSELVSKVDLIVHFAAESHVDRSIADSGVFVKTNVIGTQVLLEEARKYNVRFHHISTDEVFGTLKSDDPGFTEKTSYDPRSPYSASKAASDHLVRAYWHTYKLPITISNCSNNYGPYQFPEKFIPLFITNLIEDKEVPVYGDGMQIRDWIHVDDHNRGVDMIIKKGKIGETYNLGGDSELTNIDMAKTIIKEMSKTEDLIKHTKDRPGHDRRYAIDFTKAKKELGWQPQINFNKGLKETINWYIENKDWWQRIKSGEYRDYYKKQYEK